MPDEFDWREAVEAYGDTRLARTRAYEAVGHVLHLLQDMAQPDHAKNRPHPGNYLQDAGPMAALESLAPGLARHAKSHVGYERLWQHVMDWPPGDAPHVPASLRDSFDVMAYVSHKKEQEAGLPSRREKGELALGLAGLRIERGVGMIVETFVPYVGFVVQIPVGSLHDAAAAAGWAAFRDNLWVRYEMQVPLIPTIPWPDRDEYTEKNLVMGRKLLTLAEEHGAGLLQHFHDVVNPPAYVRSVELLQGGERKYRMAWQDGAADREGRVASRSASSEGDGLLKQGDLTEVRIRFGPLLGDAGAHVSEAVEGVQVWSQGADGTQAPVAEAGFAEDPDAPGAVMWTGSFVPAQSGTLVIEAADADRHFAGREPLGDELDSDPATPARASWGDAADGQPYPWAGYEPGPDTQHRFRVEGECVTGSLRADLVNSHRWGTVEGIVHHSTINPDGRADATSRLRLRAALSLGQNATSYLDGVIDPVAPIPHSWVGLGHVEGTMRMIGAGELSHWTADAAVVKAQGGIGLRPGEPGQPCEYGVMLGFAEDPNRSAYHGDQVEGQTCVDGSLTGRRVEDSGGSYRYEWSWSFHFTPTEPPPHVPVLQEHIRAAASIHRDARQYPDRAMKAMEAVWARMHARGYDPDAQARFTPYVTRLGELCGEAEQFDPLTDAYDEHFQGLNEAWLSSEPDADAVYQRHLDGFRAEFERYLALRRGTADEIAAATEALADAAERHDRASAKRLREMAQTLRRDGLGER
jgi:hypothetical protein